MELVVALVGLVTALVGVWQAHVARGPAPVAAAHTGGAPAVPAGAAVTGAVPGTGVSVGRMLRDAGLIFFGTGVVGFLVGLSYGGSSFEDLMAVVGLLTLVVLVVGFAVSGVRTPVPRWRHLAGVAAVLCALSLINVMIGFTGIGGWLVGVVLTGVCALAGGGVAAMIRKA